MGFVEPDATNFILSSKPDRHQMPPRHAFLFDLPLRYVLGTGVAAGTMWTLFKPTDVALAEEVSQKPKVLVRTASGAVRSRPAIPLPRAAAPSLARHALSVIPA